jgi:hypothetical protein
MPSKSRLFVIMDPDHGDRLRELEPGLPVWIAMSPANEPVIRSLWAARPSHDHLTGITGFHFNANDSAEERFLSEMSMIDLHHGPYSTSNPYTELEVIGTPLTIGIRSALLRYGFSEFSEDQDGFVATRSHEEAKRLRDC